MANARLYVPPPSFTPAPFGLLSALGTEIRSPADPHWRLGVTYEPLCAAAGTTYDECFAVTGSGLAPAPAPAAKTDSGGGLDRRGATSFTVVTEVDCSAPGFWDRAEEIVNESLTRAEQWQVERAFWTGQAAGQSVVYPHLAANAAVTDEWGITLQTAAITLVSGNAMDIAEGIGVLESAIANCYDGVAIIHVPVVLAASMSTHIALVREGSRYRTTKGNIVVFGGGYSGSGPDGTIPTGAAWVYATGGMFIYRGRPNVIPINSTVDRADNTVKAIAERTYVLGWDCCHAAVKISTGGVVTGTTASAS